MGTENGPFVLGWALNGATGVLMWTWTRKLKGFWAQLRKLLIALGSLAGITLLLLWSTGQWVKRAAEPWVYATFRAVPIKMVAIVPGASIGPDGEPSVVLGDRLETARRLYVRGKVGHILVSGDNQSRYYNETRAMKRWLVERGIPSEHIYADYAGFRTLDTMERAARVFKVHDAIICTQAFHLYRSVFLARQAKIDAVGLISDRRTYRRDRNDQAREYLARTLAFADTYVLSREPRFLGPPIPVSGPPQGGESPGADP